jgi:type I restriction enzyme R subunit
MLSDHTELFKQFSDNPSFKRWLTDSVFNLTYRPSHSHAVGLDREWLDRAVGIVTDKMGSDRKWAGIAEAVWRHFQLQLDQPLMLSDIKRMSGELGVTVPDITTVLQVLATAEPALLTTTFTKTEPETGAEKDVALGEIRQSLAGLSDRGDIGKHADDLANRVLLGWKPVIALKEAGM